MKDLEKASEISEGKQIPSWAWGNRPSYYAGPEPAPQETVHKTREYRKKCALASFSKIYFLFHVTSDGSSDPQLLPRWTHVMGYQQLSHPLKHISSQGTAQL